MRSAPANSLQRARRSGLLGLFLLALAGLRHHLVWGESASLPFNLRPWLDAFETSSVVAFAWLNGLCWLRGVQAVRADRPTLSQMVRASLPLLLLAIAVPPFFSLDVTDYVMRGRIVAIHGGNPYVDMASRYASDPFLAFGDGPWKDFPLPYGPLVADLQAAVAWLASCCGLPARGELVVAVVLFKVLMAACSVGIALTARSICREIRPAAADAMFVMVLWNPLLLGEAVATSHNEPLMVLPVLLAVRCALALRAGASTVALGVAVLSKIVPVLLGPLFVVWSVRTRVLGRLLAGAAIVAALSAAYGFRWFRVDGAFDFLQQQSAVTGASVAWAVSELFGPSVGSVLQVGRGLVVVVLAAAVVRLWRSAGRGRPAAGRAPAGGEALISGCAVVLAAMVVVGLAGFGPWYHLWWIPLALIHQRGFLLRYAIVVSWTSPCCYLLWTSARILDERHQYLELVMGLLLPLAVAALGSRSSGLERVVRRAVAPMES